VWRFSAAASRKWPITLNQSLTAEILGLLLSDRGYRDEAMAIGRLQKEFRAMGGS
jgi:hypothetical protein